MSIEHEPFSKKKAAKATDPYYYAIGKMTSDVFHEYYAYDSYGHPKVFDSNNCTIEFPYGAYSWVKEGIAQSNDDNKKIFTFPEGEWIVSDFENSPRSYISIVSATAQPKVYLAANFTDKDNKTIFAKTEVGETDASLETSHADFGMAAVTLSETQEAAVQEALDDKVQNFYDHLVIKVRKTVNKMDSASFKISVTDKTKTDSNGNLIDYSDCFEYYSDADMTQNDTWTNRGCLNYSDTSASKALGGILSDDVKIYIVPKSSMQHQITLSPYADTEHYKVYTGTNKQKEYTFGTTDHILGSDAGLYFVPDEHYELRYFSDNADSTVAWSQYDDSLQGHLDTNGNLLYQITDICENHELNLTVSPEEYPVLFDEIGENGGVYTRYSGSGQPTEYTKHNKDYFAAVVAYNSSSNTYYIKPDNENGKKYKTVLNDNSDIISLGAFDLNEDGYYTYQVKNVDTAHHLKVNFEEYGNTLIENNDYASEYAYNGKTIPAPAKSNFKIKRGTGYTDSASEDDTNGFYAGSAKFIIQIGPLNTTAEATLDGIKNGDWYIGDVTVDAPDGYQISTSQSGGFQDSLTVNEDMDGDIHYYLRDKTTEAVTGEKKITVRRDATKPTVTLSATNGDGGYWNCFINYYIFKNDIDMSVTASDSTSGVNTAEYLLSDTKFTSETEVSGNWKSLTADVTGNYSFRIPAKQKGAVCVRVTDNAGNSTIINSDGVVVYNDSAKNTEHTTYTKTTRLYHNKRYRNSECSND